jgi:proteic killer suppression protein
VIKSFDDDETAKIWSGEFSRKLPTDIQDIARRKLRMLNNSHNINDLRMPRANRLELLKGDRKGFFSIRINDQWRICFRWIQGDCHDVEIVDYHKGG